MRLFHVLTVMAFTCLVSESGVARSDAARGKAILTRDCARCHAVEREGMSPLAKAPAFKDVAIRYPPENLAESLAEGIVSGHPEMPVASYGPAEIGAIISYLEELRTAGGKGR